MGNSRKRRGRRSGRSRVGRVSYYPHHGSWWIYYLDGRRPVRRQVARSETEAAAIAAQVNGQLAAAAPTFFSFEPISVDELQRRFLEHHEQVRRSSLATVGRYRTATRHLVTYTQQLARGVRAHEVDAEDFVRFLRLLRVSPNGHPHAARRQLRDKGVRYVLETCRSMYAYAARRRHLPPYADNLFAGLGGKRFRIEDAKRIFVFDEQTELAYFRAADPWSFAVHFALAKTGARPGEIAHLLVEDLDLDSGWLRIGDKPELGWRVKTRRERQVPLVEELTHVLRQLLGNRKHGPVFVRQKFDAERAPLAGVPRERLASEVESRVARAEAAAGSPLSRAAVAAVCRTVWRDAGALRHEQIRLSFIRVAQAIGLPQATCPKSWRHTFATLLQDANVDPLIRQLTLGHAPTTSFEGALGMTTLYTHTRPETQSREIKRALRLWPQSLQLGHQWPPGSRS